MANKKSKPEKTPKKKLEEPQAQKTKEEKKEAKQVKSFEKRSCRLTYHSPHLTVNILNVPYPDIIQAIRDLCQNDETKFIKLLVGKNLEEFFVVRLEISEKEEDGLLTYWQRSDLYLLVLAVKNHGSYVMGPNQLVEDATKIGKPSYDSTDQKVGVLVFKEAVINILENIVSHDDNFELWRTYVSSLIVHLPEAVKNEFVLFDIIKPASVESNNVPMWNSTYDLIQDWKKCSKAAFQFNPEKDNGFLNDEDLKLMHQFLVPDDHLPNDAQMALLQKLKDNPRVCKRMLPVPWDYLASRRYWEHIKDILWKGGSTVGKIHAELKPRIENYESPISQIRNILCEIANKGMIKLEDGVYSLERGKTKRNNILPAGRRRTPLPKIVDMIKSHERVAIIAYQRNYSYKHIVSSASSLSTLILRYYEIVCKTRYNKSLNGDRIGVVAKPSAEFVAGLLAIWLSGGVAVPLEPSDPDGLLSHVMKDAGVIMILSTVDHGGLMRYIARKSGVGFFLIPDVLISDVDDDVHSREIQFMNQVNDHDPAMIIYTSSRHYPPKGVVHTHASILAQVQTLAGAFGYTSSDCILHCMPLHHSHGLFNALLAPLYAGSTVEFMPMDTKICKGIWRRWRESYPEDGTKSDYAVTVFTGVPTLYNMLIKVYDGMDLRRKEASASAGRQLRLMMCGSWPLSFRDMERWETITGQRPLEGYGMTEFGMAISNLLDGPRTQGTVGTPLPGVDVKILADGELCVKSPSMFKEYWKRPEVPFTEDHFFRTGDVARLNGDGNYIILGSTDADLIKFRGCKFSPVDIEAILLQDPFFSECCVLGLPHETYGEKVTAIVVRNLQQERNLQHEEIIEAKLKELPLYKQPTKYLYRESLPRDATGKVDRKQLKAEYAGKGKAKLV